MTLSQACRRTLRQDESALMSCMAKSEFSFRQLEDRCIETGWRMFGPRPKSLEPAVIKEIIKRSLNYLFGEPCVLGNYRYGESVIPFTLPKVEINKLSQSLRLCGCRGPTRHEVA